MIQIKRDKANVSGEIAKDRGSGRVRVPKGVKVTELGVRDKREPILGDTFEAEQNLSWNTDKDFRKDIIIVPYGFW